MPSYDPVDNHCEQRKELEESVKLHCFPL